MNDDLLDEIQDGVQNELNDEAPEATTGTTEPEARSESAPDPTTDDGSDDEPEPRTFMETGLEEDTDYPWDSTETVVKDANGEREQSRFEYLRIPFEVTEPTDNQQIENARGALEGLGDARQTEREQKVTNYFEKLKDTCLTVDGEDINEIYAVDREDGQRDVLHETVAQEHGLIDANGGVDRQRAADLGVTVAPLWDALTEFQRQKLGQKMDGFVSGEDQFRIRFRGS